MRKLITALILTSTLTLSACGGTHYTYSQDTKDGLSGLFVLMGASTKVANCLTDKMQDHFSEVQVAALFLKQGDMDKDDQAIMDSIYKECK